MIKHFAKRPLAVAFVAGLVAAGAATLAVADGEFLAGNHDRSHGWGHVARQSDAPKQIVIDNLDNFVVSKGDPDQAALTQEVCGDCHSTDYPATQLKMSCAAWGKEIVKMGNTFGAVVPWKEDGISKANLTDILHYLADNYGQGAAACVGNELDPLILD